MTQDRIIHSGILEVFDKNGKPYFGQHTGELRIRRVSHPTLESSAKPPQVTPTPTEEPTRYFTIRRVEKGPKP